jgi:hypothetical protein
MPVSTPIKYASSLIRRRRERKKTTAVDPTPGLADQTPEPIQPPAVMLAELAALLRRYGH